MNTGKEQVKALRAETLVRELTDEETALGVRLLREDRFASRPAKKQPRKRKAKSEESV